MDTERLRSDLREYYGTAMFNGNPMAMMELEEVERASADDLRRIARNNAFDLDRYENDSPSRSADLGVGGYNPRYDARPYRTTTVTASVRVESISRASTSFFEPAGNSDHDTGFFANYGRTLGQKARDLAENDHE